MKKKENSKGNVGSILSFVDIVAVTLRVYLKKFVRIAVRKKIIKNKRGRYALKCISALFRWCLLKYILYVEGIGVGDAFA